MKRRVIALGFLLLCTTGAAASGQESAVDFITPPADAEQSVTGVLSQMLTPGKGQRHPDPEDLVALHFIGYSPQGEKLYSSYDAGKPPVFSLKTAFPGWKEAIQLMVSGEKRRIWLPERLVAKDRGPKGASIFDFELMGFKISPKPPDSLGTPPANAQRTPSGAFTELVKAGSGEEHPGPEGTVLVHYTGWTTDGKVFDSSHQRGRPTGFPLSQVMPAFAETVQLMVVGEKRRVWIPGAVAGGNWINSPKGMLVFEINLVKILSDDALQKMKPVPPGARQPMEQRGSG